MSIDRWIATAVVAGLALASQADADIIKLANQAPRVVVSHNSPRPGMTRNQVAQRFGAPERKVPAVGDPPISRWDYGGYSVYFEGNLVLHDVVHENQLDTAQAAVQP